MTALSDLHCFAIPMRERFRGTGTREGLLFRGPAGWAEFSPFADYGADDCVPWLAAAKEAAYRPWPSPVRDEVPVNCTVPAVGQERAVEIVRASAGCRTAKVKVAEPGQDEHHDLARVAAVRDAVGRDGRVRVDANGGWDVDRAVRMIRRLDAAAGGLEYVEQPCCTVEELAQVRKRVDVPVAADESIRRTADPFRVAALEAADVAVLKVQPMGGVAACLRVAERIALPVVVSSAVETSVGLAAGVALAAALPELPYACGLGTVQLLTSDVVDHCLSPNLGMIGVRRPEPSVRRLTMCRPDAGTVRRWEQRISAVEAVAGRGAW